MLKFLVEKNLKALLRWTCRIRQFVHKDRIFNSISRCFLIALITFLVSSNCTGSTVNANEKEKSTRKTITTKKLRVAFDTLFANGIKINTSGELLLNVENLEIATLDESVKLFAKKASLRLKLLTLLRLKVIPKIEKLEYVTIDVNIDTKTKGVEKKDKNIELQEQRHAMKKSMFKAISFVENVITGMLPIGGDALVRPIVEDVYINIKNDKIIKTIYVKSIATQPPSKSRITSSILKDTNSNMLTAPNIIVGSAEVENLHIPFGLSCESRAMDTHMCRLFIDNISSEYIRKFTHSFQLENREVFFASNLNASLELYFGSIFTNDQFRGTIKLLDGTKATILMDTDIELGPATIEMYFDINKLLLRSRTNLALKNIGDAKVGFLYKMLSESDWDKEILFTTGNIDVKYAEKILPIVGKCGKKLHDIMNAITSNIGFEGGFGKITKGIVRNSKDVVSIVDIVIEATETSVSLRRLNDLLLRDVESVIKIGRLQTVVDVHGGKIANAPIKYAKLDFFTIPDGTKRFTFDIEAEKINAVAALKDPSMPDWTKIVVDIAKVDPQSHFSTKIFGKMNLSDKFDIVKHFQYDSVVNINYMTSIPMKTVEKPIVINVHKSFNSSDLSLNVDMADAILNIGSDVLIKAKEDKRFLEINMKDVFRNWLKNIHLDSVKFFDDKGKKNGLIIDLATTMNVEYTFKECSFDMDIKKFELFETDLMGHFNKKVGHDYNYNLKSRHLHWGNLIKVFSAMSDASNSGISLKDISFDGKIEVDKVTFFNDVVCNWLVVDANFNKTRFGSTYITGDFYRINSAGDKFLIYADNFVSDKNTRKKAGFFKTINQWTKTSKGQKKNSTSSTKKTQAKFQNSDNIGTSMDIEPMSLLVNIIDKGAQSEIYASAGNIRIIMDAFDVKKAEKIFGGKIRFIGNQNAKHIFGRMIAEDVIFCPEAKRGAEQGDLPCGSNKREALISNIFSSIRFHMAKELLQIPELTAIADILTAKFHGEIDFAKRDVYMSGTVNISNKNKVFDISEIPVLGKALQVSVDNKRSLLRLAVIVDGSFDGIEDKVTVKPSKSMFFVAAIVVVTLFGLSLGILGGIL